MILRKYNIPNTDRKIKQKAAFFITAMLLTAQLNAQGYSANAVKLIGNSQTVTIQPSSGMSSGYSLTFPATAPSSNGQFLSSTTGGVLSWVTAPTGTVTSVGLSLPSIFTVSNSPVTTSGTITATLASQNANTVFAGPSSGAAAAPTFRALVAADIPSHTHAITDITSFNISSPLNTQTLQYNGSQWVNANISNLYASTGMINNVVTITGAYTAKSTDFSIFCNVSSAFTITLPDATTTKGQVLNIRVIPISSSIASVTIDPYGTQKIDGNTTYSLSKSGTYSGMTIQSDGANWYFLGLM